MLITLVSSAVLASSMAMTPMGPGQQGRLAALIAWAEAYRDCYATAPYSMKIDEGFTAKCIEVNLGRLGKGGPVEEHAAVTALIADTPRLISLLNAPTAGRGEMPLASAPLHARHPRRGDEAPAAAPATRP